MGFVPIEVFEPAPAAPTFNSLYGIQLSEINEQIRRIATFNSLYGIPRNLTELDALGNTVFQFPLWDS